MKATYGIRAVLNDDLRFTNNYLESTFEGEFPYAASIPITGTNIMAGVNTTTSSDPYPEYFSLNGPHATGIFANPNPGMWMYGDTLARLARLAPGVLHADLSACNAYGGGMDAAAKVACPALFVLGARDMMTPPRAAQALAGALKNGKTVTVGPSGHSLMAEAPDATLDALIAFVS